MTPPTLPSPSSSTNDANSEINTSPALTPQYPQQNHTPQLPVLLLILAIASILLLILVGGGLFFFPEFSGPFWVWTLTPFNQRFLGAI
ncbi:MAG: hypothetical protein AAFU53_19570, partial [Cyanobacteria bacterium J06632_3]